MRMRAPIGTEGGIPRHLGALESKGHRESVLKLLLELLNAGLLKEGNENQDGTQACNFSICVARAGGML